MTTALVAVALAGLLLAPTAWAQSATATLTANANLRSGPGTSFAKVGSAALGSTVTLAGCTAAGDWCRLTDGTWVFAELLDSVPAGLPEAEDVTAATPAPTRAAGGLLPTATPNRAAAGATPAPTAPATSGPVAAGNANLRSGPGTGFERVGSVAAGQALAIVGKTAAGDWYQLDDGAWIAAFLVSGEVGDVAVVVVAAVPAPSTAAASQSVSTPPAPAVSGERSLFVEFINPVYNCQNDEFEFEAAPGIMQWIDVYRSFQVDMYITNNGTTPIEPPWRPRRWIITDGQTEMVNDMMWEWMDRNTGQYAQPTIFPGQSAGWTWVAMPVGRNEWVKAVEYEHDGQVYRQEFDLGRYGNAYGYKDCGIEGVHKYRPTPTPRP